MVFENLDPNAPLAMARFAGSLRAALRRAGPPPWSIAEARLQDNDYMRLKAWAFREGRRAIDQPTVGGLLLVALIAEFNRREGLGSQIWVGVPELFNAADRPTLFNIHRNATALLRTVIEAVVKQEQLRHAFHETDDRDEHRWYNTLQLQYGFARSQSAKVSDWVATRQLPLACRRLLDPESPYRSKSFQRLFDTLHRVWTDQLPTTAAKEDLEENYWILSDCIEPVLHELASRPSYDGDSEPLSPQLAAQERLEWDAIHGPLIRIRLTDAVPLPCGSDRCTLSCNALVVGEWIRTGVGDRFTLMPGTSQIPIDTDTVHYVLEDESGTVSEDFRKLDTVTADKRVLVVGRRLTLHRSVPCRDTRLPIVIVTDPAERVEPTADAWALVRSESDASAPVFKRWSYFDPPHRRIDVFNEDNELTWSTAVIPQPPGHQLSVHLHNPETAYGIRDRFRLHLSTTPPAVVTDVCVDERPVTVTHMTTERLQCNLGHTTLGVEVAATLRHLGRTYRRRQRIRLPVVGIARCHKAALRALWPTDVLRFSQSSRGDFRLFSPNTMPWIHEGAKALRLHAHDRLLPRGLAGRGAQLTVSSERYAGGKDITIAIATEDHGEVKRIHVQASTNTAEITFWRAKSLRDAHSIALWAPTLGMAHVPYQHISACSGNIRWRFPLPDAWCNRELASSVAVAVAYDGECRGWDFVGRIEDFCKRDESLNAFLDPLSHFAALRWFQLPVLLSSGRGNAIDDLANASPHKMIVAWLSENAGLDACRQACGLPLAFNSTTTADADVLRETLWKTRPSEECAEDFAHDMQGILSSFWHDERGLQRSLQEAPLCVTSFLRSWASILPAHKLQLRALCGVMLHRLIRPYETPDIARQRLAEEASQQLGMQVDAFEFGSVRPAITYWESGTFAADYGDSQALEHMCKRVHHSSKYRQCLMFDLCKRLELVLRS
jgi:hypothetical protein